MMMKLLADEVKLLLAVSHGRTVSDRSSAVRSNGRSQVAGLGVGAEGRHLVGVAGLPVDLGAELVVSSSDADVKIR